MKGKSLLAAVLIVLFAALSLGLYLVANDQRNQVPRYGFINPYNDHLLVQFGQHLVWLNQDADEVRSLDLRSLGLETSGDIAEFNNGDVLVYHRTHSPSLLSNIQSFLRLRETQPPALQQPEGLKRCSRFECVSFSQALPAFEGAFRLLIEPHSQQVHIANTREFRLYLLNQYGDLLAKTDTDTFRFPNQLALRGDQIWVADTNNFRLAQINNQPEHYGQVEQSLKMPRLKTHKWPHQMAWDDQQWWVNLGDNNLSHGRIIALNEKAQVNAEITHQNLPDPLASAWFAGSLWLTDYSAPQLLRFAANGQALPKPNSPTLDALQTQSQADISFWQLTSQLALGAFVVVMLAGFAAAWLLEREQTVQVLKGTLKDQTDTLIAQPAAPLAEDEIIWIDNHLANYRGWISLGFSALLLALAGTLGVFLFGESSNTLKWLVLIISLATVIPVLSTFWLFRRLSQQHIGISQEHFYLEQDPNRRMRISHDQLGYSVNYLTSHDACISLGNGAPGFFNRSQLRQHLYPRLKRANKQNPWQIQRALWRCRHPQVMIWLYLIPMAPLLMLATYLT